MQQLTSNWNTRQLFCVFLGLTSLSVLFIITTISNNQLSIPSSTSNYAISSLQMNKWIPQWIDYSNIPTNERSNISYDRELQCLSRTHGYEYPLQWSNFSDPIIIWEWNYSSNYQDINPDYSVVITLFDSLN
eukprot:325075_1